MTGPLFVQPCPKCHGTHEDRALYSCAGCGGTLCAAQAGPLASAYYHRRVLNGRPALCGPLGREHVTVDLEVAEGSR